LLKALLTDIDGTITGPDRRISTGAIEIMRDLKDHDIELVLASGNTACFMDALSRMIGTNGSFIAENGGVYRIGYTGDLKVLGDQSVCKEALSAVKSFFKERGVELDMYSAPYRYADVAFAKTVPVSEVVDIVRDFPVEVLDTGFAIHIQQKGVHKGTAFRRLAEDIGIPPAEFLAIGDAINDREMIQMAGTGVAVANAHAVTKNAAQWVSQKSYGEGFIEAIQRYFPYFLER
jgi:phosphoglycolate phosphatase (TIGR01487 family)